MIIVTHFLGVCQSQVPKMFAFPKLREIFSTIAETIPARVRTNLNVIQVNIKHKKCFYHRGLLFLSSFMDLFHSIRFRA